MQKFKAGDDIVLWYKMGGRSYGKVLSVCGDILNIQWRNRTDSIHIQDMSGLMIKLCKSKAKSGS